MFKTTVFAATSLGCLLSATAGTVEELKTTTSSSPIVPQFDAVRAVFSYSGEMNFEDGPGNLDVSRFELRAILARPLKPIDGLSLIPVFEYEATAFDFNDTPAGFPINDEELHSIGLSGVALYSPHGSPWFFGGWGRAEMASDFQEVGSDDFTFDLAAGAGYRFTDQFQLAVGVAVVNLNGDTTFYPGISFDWVVNDQVRIGLYGPNFAAAYAPDENWEFSVRADSGGDIWNIRDAGGTSRSIDLTSYRLGLFASRRLSGELWLTAGAGATIGNEITLTQPDGDELFEQDMESGLFGQVGLRLRTW